MTTTTAGIAATTPDRQAEDRVDAASRTVHAAEGQLHTALLCISQAHDVSHPVSGAYPLDSAPERKLA